MLGSLDSIEKTPAKDETLDTSCDWTSDVLCFLWITASKSSVIFVYVLFFMSTKDELTT